MSRGDAVTRKLVTFGRILREVGVEVGPGRLQDALRGLDSLDDDTMVDHVARAIVDPAARRPSMVLKLCRWRFAACRSTTNRLTPS